MLQLIEHSKQGITGSLRVEAIHNAPLVMANGMPSFKDSSDGLAVCFDQDGSKHVLPIEVKSRVTERTFRAEREQLQHVHGYQAFRSGDPFYKEIHALDPDLPLWVPKSSELFQLLHHVMMYDTNRGILLVGNANVVVYGLIVSITLWQSIDRSIN